MLLTVFIGVVVRPEQGGLYEPWGLGAVFCNSAASLGNVLLQRFKDSISDRESQFVNDYTNFGMRPADMLIRQRANAEPATIMTTG